MNSKIIVGEAPFQVLSHSLGISPSESGYVLNYSADGISFTEWDEATPANENCMVLNFPKGMYFKLVGNTGNVKVTF